MIQQSFKLMWNQRRKHFGLSFEIFFSFLVLFLVFSFGLDRLDKYLNPLGFSYENVWSIENLDRNAETDSMTLEVDRIVKQNLSTFPQIRGYSFCDYNIPFSGSAITSNIDKDNLSVDAQIHTVDDSYFELMEMNVLEGNWFSEADRTLNQDAVVITEDLAEFLFPEESAIGKSIEHFEKANRIVGVCSNFHFKGGVLEAPHAVFFQKKADQLLPSLLFKVAEGVDADFEARLVESLQQMIPGTKIRIKYIEEMREEYLLLSIIPTLLLGIIGIFLIFNVALGLFGVLWQNIRRRTQEIGVRMALGSSKGQIIQQFVLETLALTSISLIVGLFFAVQFPLLHVLEVKTGIYLAAIVFAIISIYLLVIVCALIPSAQAAELHPATALREE